MEQEWARIGVLLRGHHGFEAITVGFQPSIILAWRLYESAPAKKMDHREMEMALQKVEVSPSSKAWFWCLGEQHSFGKWMLVDIFLGFLVPGVEPKT